VAEIAQGRDRRTVTRILAALALVLAAADASAETARSDYQASLRVIEVEDRSARKACRSGALPTRATCLDKAVTTRSASRAQAGVQLKADDTGRTSGREIMAAYKESVADAERTGLVAATDKCGALSHEERGPCTAATKALYRR
jgi:hypothetical protein